MIVAAVEVIMTVVATVLATTSSMLRFAFYVGFVVFRRFWGWGWSWR